MSLPQVSRGAHDANEHAATPRDASEAPVANSVAELLPPGKALELALLEAAKAGQWAVVTALARELDARRTANVPAGEPV